MNKLHLFLVTLAVTVLLIVVAQRKDDPAQFEEISHSTYPEAINTWRFIHSASASGDVKLLRMDHQQAVLENADSEVLAKMEGQLPYAIFSAKGSCFATVRSLQKPDITRQITEWQIDFFDAALNKKYSVRMPRFIDESEPVIALSEKGDDWLSGRSAMGTIELWQGEKRRMANLVLFADAEHDLERTLLIRYQPSGQKFAVLASKRGAAPTASPISLFFRQTESCCRKLPYRDMQPIVWWYPTRRYWSIVTKFMRKPATSNAKRFCLIGKVVCNGKQICCLKQPFFLRMAIKCSWQIINGRWLTI